MKKVLPLFFVFCSSILFAQWERIGNPIFGEAEFDFSGICVDIDESGDRIIIHDGLREGDPKGRARVYDFVNGNWQQIGNQTEGLQAENLSSHNVRLSADGNRYVFSSRLHIVNSNTNVGGARLFEIQGGNWVQVGSTLVGDQQGDLFGDSIDISDDGSIFIVGASQTASTPPLNGYVKVYELQGSNLVQLGSTIFADNELDSSGQSVAMNSSGTRIAFSAPNFDHTGTDRGLVRIFEFQNNDWVQLGNDIYGEFDSERMGRTIEQGSSALAFNEEGNVLAIGSMDGPFAGPGFGFVRVFELINGVWEPRGGLIEPTDQNTSFGLMVSLDKSGNTLAVGDLNGYNNGSARTFRFVDNTWNEFFDPLVPDIGFNSLFGLSLALNGNGERLVIGAASFDIPSIQNRGYTEVYDRDLPLGTPSDFALSTAKIYPNPSKDYFNLVFPEATQAEIRVYDFQGRKVLDYKSPLSESTMTINHSLSSGVYLVEVNTDDSRITKKLMVY